MNESNFERMIKLAGDVFDVKNDPDQLDVNEEVIARLRRIHPFTISEHKDENGPLVWILMIPTTQGVMYRFLNKEITEKQLLELTPLDVPYDAIYLCSAMVLPEFRGHGLAKNLALEAIENIRNTNPIRDLFVWPFTEEGDALADTLAAATSLPLLKRLK